MICKSCEGRGYVEIEKRCEICMGSGKAKSFNPKITTNLNSEQLNLFMKGICGACEGSGVVKKFEVCKNCNGKGKVSKCKICGKNIVGNYDLCPVCRRKPHAYLLKNSCGIEDIRLNNVYVGKVISVTDIGVFVSLNKRLKGLIHKKNLKNNLREGDEVLVKVSNIRPSGEIDLILNPMDNYEIVNVSKDVPFTNIREAGKNIGRMVEIRGKVVHIKQTSGPTIFTIVDETSAINAAAFEGGERAYPEISVDDVVRVIGIVKRRDNKLQIEVFEMERLLGEEAHRINKSIQKELERKANPEFKGFLIESKILEKLKEEMIEVARELRKAVLESRPIIIRHHWDADGICGGVAIEKALIDFIEKVHPDPDAKDYLIRRRVSRAPYYEFEDVVKDLDESLEDMEKFGDKIPLVVLVDNGSGYEDIPAIRQFLIFGADVIAIDHHFPDEEVDNYLLYHVNPYKVGGDSNYTSGVLSVEIARMVSNINLTLLAATSVVSDRAEGEVEEYIKLSGFNREFLQDVSLALEFEAFHLRFRHGSPIIHEILGFGRKDRQQKLVSLLSSLAKDGIERQVRTAMEGVKIQKLKNGVILIALDIENYAKKFTFPPPGKLTGEVHDRFKREYERIVTIGYGPDFAVIRSEGVELDIPRLVKEIQEEVNAEVEGGGHLVVGSIKFVPAMRREVLARLASKIGEI